MSATAGAGRVREAVDGAEPAGDGLEVVCVADVQAQTVRWLWPGRFALGKLSLIAGDPGLGKSMLSLTMAAHVSRGLLWPDRTECPAGSALLICGEDDIADTIRPRLEAAGADLARVIVVTLARDKGKRRGFDLERDTAELLAKASAKTDCRLIVIDPISAYLGKTDSHNNSEVRGLLSVFAEGVARIGAAAVMVSHLNKGTEKGNALYRASGSLAFVAAARSSYVVAKDHDDPKRRLFLPTKQNLAPDGDGLAYRVVVGENGAPCLAFEPDPVTITANEALAAAPAGPQPRESAADWLRERLADGPVAVREILDESAENGIAEKTLRRAKSQLKVENFKASGTLDGGWFWRMPGAEDGHIDRRRPPSMGRETGHLGGEWPSSKADSSRRGSHNCLRDDVTLPQSQVDDVKTASASSRREFDL
jgi:putative DNA primase/helicase